MNSLQPPVEKPWTHLGPPYSSTNYPSTRGFRQGRGQACSPLIPDEFKHRGGGKELFPQTALNFKHLKPQQE